MNEVLHGLVEEELPSLKDTTEAAKRWFKGHEPGVRVDAEL